MNNYALEVTRELISYVRTAQRLQFLLSFTSKDMDQISVYRFMKVVSEIYLYAFVSSGTLYPVCTCNKPALQFR